MPVSELRLAIASKVPPEGSVTKRQRRRIENAEALKLLYLRAIPRVYTVSAALRAAGATSGDLSRWRQDDPDFVRSESEARDAVADMLESEAIRRGVKGVRQPV